MVSSKFFCFMIVVSSQWFWVIEYFGFLMIIIFFDMVYSVDDYDDVSSNWKKIESFFELINFCSMY